jgi:hypothetical protein
VATTRSGRRGPRKPADDEPQGDGLQWPGYREQLRLRAGIPEAEQRAAEQRAQVLVSQGYGALLEWLQHPGQHPGERTPQPTLATACDSAAKGEAAVRRKPDRLADLFDAA